MNRLFSASYSRLNLFAQNANITSKMGSAGGTMFGMKIDPAYDNVGIQRELDAQRAKYVDPEKSESAKKLYHQHVPKVIDSDRSTNEVRTIDDLRNRAVIDVNRLLETGQPPTTLSSELLVELITAWRTRLLYGIALVLVAGYLGYRSAIEGTVEVLSLGMKEQPFRQALKDVQVAKTAFIAALAAEVR